MPYQPTEQQRRALAALAALRRTQTGLQPPTEIPPPPNVPTVPSTPPALKWTERHSRWVSAISKIVSGVIAIGGIVLASIGYAWHKAASAIIADLHIDPICVQVATLPNEPKVPSLADRFEAIDLRMKAAEKKLSDPTDPTSKLGGQLDRIETMLLKDHEINAPKKPPPPAIGPTAAQHGRQ